MPYQYYVGGIAQALENPDKKSKVDYTRTSPNELVIKKGGHAVASNASEDLVKHSKKRKLKSKGTLFNSPSASANELVIKKGGHAVASNASEDLVKHSKKRKLKGKRTLFNTPSASANEVAIKKAVVSTVPVSDDLVKLSKKRKLKDKSNRPREKVKGEILEKSVHTPSGKKKPKNRVKAKQNQQTCSVNEESEYSEKQIEDGPDESADDDVDPETEPRTKRIKKDGSADHCVDPEQEARTVFLGNLPLSVTRKDLKTLFSCYGRVESVRHRSVVPLKIGMPKKVAVIQNKFNTEKDSINAYVVMDSVESANKALVSNGMILQGHHVRVDLAGKKEHDHKLSVFVGNLPFNCQDEELYNFFGESFEIESVRVVRDSGTGICKGFGFVTFKSKDSVELAMKMDKEFKGRQLRVKRSKKQQTMQHKKTSHIGKKQKFEGNKCFEGVKSSKGVNERKRMQRKIKFANLASKQKALKPGSTYQDGNTNVLNKQKAKTDGRAHGNTGISNRPKRKEMKSGSNYKDGRTYGNANMSNKPQAMKRGTYGNANKAMKRGTYGNANKANGNANKAMKRGGTYKGGRTYGDANMSNKPQAMKRGGAYKDGRAYGNANKQNAMKPGGNYKDGRVYGKGQRKNKFNAFKNKK